MRDKCVTTSPQARFARVPDAKRFRSGQAEQGDAAGDQRGPGEPAGPDALVQLPTIIGVAAIAYNLPSVDKLQLDGTTLSAPESGNMPRTWQFHQSDPSP